MIEKGPFSMTEKSPTPMGLQVVGQRGLFEQPRLLLFLKPVGVTFNVQHMAMMEQPVGTVNLLPLDMISQQEDT